MFYVVFEDEFKNLFLICILRSVRYVERYFLEVVIWILDRKLNEKINSYGNRVFKKKKK